MKMRQKEEDNYKKTANKSYLDEDTENIDPNIQLLYQHPTNKIKIPLTTKYETEP